ncbi:MAG: type II CAAX endopeptidase family protein [Myxococcota bacterium]
MTDPGGGPGPAGDVDDRPPSAPALDGDGSDRDGAGRSDDDTDDDAVDRLEAWALDVLTVLFYLPVALGSLLYLFYVGGEFALWVRTVGEHVPRDVAAGLAVGLAVVGASYAAVPLSPIAQRMVGALARAVGRPSWTACLVVAASSAIGEELLFRAVLQERLGVLIATLLFALAHFPAERDLWPWPVIAFPLGLAFAGLYAWSGAALAPIVAHAVINLLNLRLVGRWVTASDASGATGSAR